MGDVVEEVDAVADDQAGGDADHGCRPWRHERARRRDGYEAGQHAIARHRDIGFAVLGVGPCHCGHRAEAAGEQCVDGDDCDTQISCPERRTGVETHPSEDEHERADDDVPEVVAGYRIG